MLKRTHYRRTLLQTTALTAFIAGQIPTNTQAATVLDVTGATSYTQAASIGGNFTVQKAFVQPSGTGVFQAFLGMQQPANVKSNDPPYEYTTAQLGFNTNNTNPHPPLDVLGGTHTSALLLSDIPIIQIGSNYFYEFVLDVDQVSNGPISLNQVQLFQSDTDLGTAPNTFTITGPSAGVDAVISFAGLSPVFQMNPGNHTLATSWEVKVNSGSGNGSADMYLYVDYFLFDHTKTLSGAFVDPYVTLFSQFGAPPGAIDANSSFEEWGIRKGAGGLPPADNHGFGDGVPEPGSFAVWLLLGAVATVCRRRRKPASSHS